MTTDERTVSGSVRYLLVAFTAFSLATLHFNRVAIVGAVLVGGAFIVLSMYRRESPSLDFDMRKALVLVVVLFALITIAGPAYPVIGDPPAWIYAGSGAAWLVIASIWLASRRHLHMSRIVFALTLLMSVIIGAVYITSAKGVGYDVYFLHEQAADAISRGISPYSDAVQFANGAPNGDAAIVGYPYPPATALSYSLGSWALGDSRWTSLAAWLVVLAVIGTGSRRHAYHLRLGMMLAAASLPGLPFVLTAGWTEPLSLALVAVSVLVWSRPRLAGAFGGLFVASKQYLVVTLPLYATNRTPKRWRRAIWAGVAFVVAFLPILVWGTSDFLDAAVRYHLEAPPRTDGTSIVGLLSALGVNWVPSVWFMVVAVIGVSIIIRRRIVDAASWLSATALILTIALFLASQAFANYWFLIAGISALAMTVEQPRVREGSGGSEQSAVPLIEAT